MPVDREAVVANAKYLRQVRPIDPLEIADYVPDEPDPRVVAQVLREEAVELGLVERTDGAFVPAAEGPYRPAFDGVESLPTEYSDGLIDLLVAAYGPRWEEGESGVAIRKRISRLKAEYYRQASVAYDEDVALAYAIYHLPDYYATMQYILAELAGDGLLPSRLEVLDVGAGVGGPALGLADFYEPGNRNGETPADPTPSNGGRLALVDYTAVEPSEAADVLESMLEPTGPNFHWGVHRERAESFEPAGEFDLVLFSNVLSELERPADVVDRYLDALAPDGSMVLVAPADRNTSIQLREVERGVEARGATVYGPTVRLWPGERPTTDSWSFDQRPDIEVPPVQERLATGADRPSEMVNTSIKYSYSVLRTDGMRRWDLELDTADVARMADMERHVSNRIDLVAAKLSRNLADDGHPLYKVSDGSERENHFAVLVTETELNRDLMTADYGDLLSFQQVLALWNEDEGAYNLVVDEETLVDTAS